MAERLRVVADELDPQQGRERLMPLDDNDLAKAGRLSFLRTAIRRRRPLLRG